MPVDVEHAAAGHDRKAPWSARRTIVLCCVVGVLLILALVAAVGTLQRDIYSPRGLVTGYLDALSSQNAEAALSVPGVNVSATRLASEGVAAHPSRELLRDDLIRQPGNVSIRSDVALPGGDHRVLVDFTLGSQSKHARFTLRQTGAIFGILPNWRFAVSPLAVMSVTVLHGDSFSVAGHTFNTRAADPGQAPSFDSHADYLVFAPGQYRLGLASTLLGANPVTATVTNGGEVAKASVDVQPTRAFNSRVFTQLGKLLDTCTHQHVLEPTGCPFGVEIDNRIEGVPTWTMVDYPAVNLAPGTQGWLMPPATGVAHVRVTVQSLLDGSVSKRSTDESFTVSLSKVVILPDGSPMITLG